MTDSSEAMKKRAARPASLSTASIFLTICEYNFLLLHSGHYMKTAPDAVKVMANAKRPVDATPAGFWNKCGCCHVLIGLN
jgi:hypothetical protein